MRLDRDLSRPASLLTDINRFADGLTPLLAPRPPPSIPLHHHRRFGFDGECLTEADITWSLRHPDVRADPTVSALDDDSTLTDLERMGVSGWLVVRGKASELTHPPFAAS